MLAEGLSPPHAPAQVTPRDISKREAQATKSGCRCLSRIELGGQEAALQREAASSRSQGGRDQLR